MLLSLNTGSFNSVQVANQTLRNNNSVTLAPPPFSGAGDVRFTLRGTTYQNNSLVTLENIGEGDGNALLCVTDNSACCGRMQVSGMGILGDWYNPNGTGAPNQGDGLDLYRNRGPSIVRLNRRRGGVTGIYRCEIPDTMNANQTIYIGVYSADTGEWYM